MTIKTPTLTPDFQQWILSNIPLLQTMQLQFDGFDNGVLTMSCPLEPNINDKGTGFGGSIGALATICGWTYTMIHAKTALEDPEAMIVDQSMKFHAPVTGTFTASCSSAIPDDFHQRLQEGRNGKLHLEIAIHSNGEQVATYQGFYIARKRT
ncbi:YiiD C-terminal domain-containing protein [Endozoicomonas numazuensis]|uniref:YiiD C-terminal domain-containing protein n=1 Tax=Endozoicomonas numazuensis TaxID=1137799 RepID=UPI002E7FBC50|nr:YiiD C-terminal domain-containing protein [Endozoicomonas numazuensis]